MKKYLLDSIFIVLVVAFGARSHADAISFLDDLQKRNPNVDLDRESIAAGIEENILDLRGLPVKVLPPTIGEQLSLTALILEDTEIEFLPDEIGALKNLDTLEVHHTPLKELPSTIGLLKNLVTLNLSDTKLSTLPAAIGGLDSLRDLDISQTLIKKLPGEIVQLKNLSNLMLPKEGFSASKREVTNYFASTAQSNDQPLHVSDDDITSHAKKLAAATVIEKYGDAHRFYEMIFSPSSLAAAANKDTERIPSANPKKIIFNQQKYDEGVKLPKANARLVVGKPLMMPARTPIISTRDETGKGRIDAPVDCPIGYNIFLPPQNVEAVVVEVYGGHQVRERIKEMSKPSPTNLTKHLVAQGIAVITLNLIDLIHSRADQNKQAFSIHDAVHGSINYFFETIKNRPESLHDDLHVLRGKKVFLYGASFGGRTAVRHAELYVDTYDGYLSHDGWLSPWMALKTSVGFRKQGSTATSSSWLYPMTKEVNDDVKIKRIKQPVLLLHNVDDNNVNIKVTLDWFNKAKLVGKGDLVKLFISEEGNPIVDKDRVNKGHFVPTRPHVAKAYVDTITHFILKGPSQLPRISDWRNARYTISAHKNYQNATALEKFISEAFAEYRASFPAGLFTRRETAALVEKDWPQRYRPIYFLVSMLEELKDKPEQIKEKIAELSSQGLLSSPYLARTLQQQLPGFVKYLQEMGELARAPDIALLANDATLQEQLINNFLVENVNNTLLRFLYDYYRGNFSLIKDRIPTTELIGEHDAKTALRDAIFADQVAIQAVWKQLMKTVKP